MSKQKKPHISFMARPRGRKYQNISISLTMEQIAYLDSQPNPSQLIRNLLSAHMELAAKPQDGETLASLKIKLERVDKEYSELNHEFWTFIGDHSEKLFEDGHWHLKDGQPAFAHGAPDRLIRTYRDYERRLRKLDDIIMNLKRAIVKAEEISQK